MNVVRITPRIPTIARSIPSGVRSRQAFTLIEVMLVMVILAILAAVVVPRLVGRGEQAKETAAQTTISNMATALKTFEIDNGSFPTSDQGLAALVAQPAGEYPSWKKLLDEVPNDPWGHPYIYRFPGTSGKDFDLISCGPDGREGTDDDLHNR